MAYVSTAVAQFNQSHFLPTLGKIEGLGQKGGTNPISAGIMAGAQLASQVVSYWRQQSLNNANKIKATNEAEGFVKIFWAATSANCEIKTDGAVWAYGEPESYLNSLHSLPVASPRFCEESVAGLIERCRLTEATVLLGFVMQDAQTLASSFSYFANWYYAYGMNNIAFLMTRITDAYAFCPSADSGTSTGNGTGTTITSSMDWSTIALIGAAGFLLFSVMS